MEKKFDELTDENQQEKMIKAEVWFTVNYEMACTPTDFFMRRTGRLFFDTHSVNMYKDFVFTEFEDYFSWDKKTSKKYQQELDLQLKVATTFE
jgi:glycerol-3-phosphate dehydrogenase